MTKRKNVSKDLYTLLAFFLFITQFGDMKDFIKLCPVCLAPVFGRPDKVFCSEKCKNTYHYRSKYWKNGIKNRMMSSLDLNYKILEALVASGATSAKKEKLQAMGFDFSVCTSSKKGRCGHTLNCCFDMQYAQTASKIFNLKKLD